MARISARDKSFYQHMHQVLSFRNPHPTRVEVDSNKAVTLVYEDVSGVNYDGSGPGSRFMSYYLNIVDDPQESRPLTIPQYLITGFMTRVNQIHSSIDYESFLARVDIYPNREYPSDSFYQIHQPMLTTSFYPVGLYTDTPGEIMPPIKGVIGVGDVAQFTSTPDAWPPLPEASSMASETILNMSRYERQRVTSPDSTSLNQVWLVRENDLTHEGAQRRVMRQATHESRFNPARSIRYHRITPEGSL